MAHRMRVRRSIARGALKVTRWRLVGDVPEAGILVGAPHTSQWDWVAMLMIAWANGARPRVLVAAHYFDGPVGWVLRRTGGIPLDRSSPGATVRALLKAAEEDDAFQLVIAPEGTRSKGEFWKPGFYRISEQTGLPVTLGFVDGPTRTLGMGPSFHPSGDVAADMDLVRAFYADKQGIKPELRTEPRLREETAEPPTDR
ncbi:MULTISPECIES: 1-acyl-sn-glycerol-3-phosphate acyltransferase [unclassified Nocardioides]|uniref:1-acyl-sn-glycerol-3-phosphate acyltransferase n=1 Tax=unclassified Nocardioides TaxID=2615069 RepID=UPI0011668461|nr:MULTISPECIES: 1-acyl-sn-glycerol-3-phosphate acyltransferase [unclassified Nocardioides]TQK71927.1 acyltransferase-like protein [Nocardioides sp. SLBN-35]WGY03878.1 1-acyl-sn-glycerol-3-phosphate acyltransferase [Nocardioides sp. QY071]